MSHSDIEEVKSGIGPMRASFLVGAMIVAFALLLLECGAQTGLAATRGEGSVLLVDEPARHWNATAQAFGIPASRVPERVRQLPPELPRLAGILLVGLLAVGAMPDSQRRQRRALGTGLAVMTVLAPFLLDWSTCAGSSSAGPSFIASTGGPSVSAGPTRSGTPLAFRGDDDVLGPALGTFVTDEDPNLYGDDDDFDPLALLLANGGGGGALPLGPAAASGLPRSLAAGGLGVPVVIPLIDDDGGNGSNALLAGGGGGDDVPGDDSDGDSGSDPGPQVPEPGAALLFGLGALATARLRRGGAGLRR